jgi:adenosyl cobinamide kinase/adenosyl cobinamide phosphate guanylyltransferase
MSKNDLIDLVRLIDFQTKEQYRAVMILGPANCGKTRFAKLLAEKIRAKYIDLMETFVDDENLSKSIDTFDVFGLKKYLLKLTAEEPVIIVDNIDFLLNTWSEREKGEFLNLIDKLRSNETKKTLCFFVQEEDIFDSKRILNSRNESRIIHLNQIAHIKETSM